MVYVQLMLKLYLGCCGILLSTTFHSVLILTQLEMLWFILTNLRVNMLDSESNATFPQIMACGLTGRNSGSKFHGDRLFQTITDPHSKMSKIVKGPNNYIFCAGQVP